jgi:hypothetical protein
LREDVNLYKNDSVKSANQFYSIVKPKLEELLKSEINIIEEYEEDNSSMYRVSKELDMYSGVDGWRFDKANQRHQYIASRIQIIKKGFKPFNTFSIRASRQNSKTEYEKRIYAIENDWLYPQLTIQTYLDDTESEILSLGIVYTRELFLYAKNNFDYLMSRAIKNKDNSSSFITITFSELENNLDSKKILVYKNL